ncbi:hypothetical protein I310_00969 [Cryptococcus deuterogattii CA1014]|nr:hypothetical protein I310_00969 [Cryptococcus deuterogattii CA1014]
MSPAVCQKVGLARDKERRPMLIGWRSDLLSRHVNKAHRAPEEGASDKKPTKKGRRKSVPASSHSALARARIQEQDEEQRRQLLQRQQFECQQQQQQQLLQQQMQQEAVAVRERSKSESLNQQPHLQALRMYPHHPLLASRPVQPSIASDSWNTNPSGSFAAAGMTAMSPPFDSTPQRLGGNFQAFQGQPFLVGQLPNDPPFTGQPMRLSGSDQGMKTADGHSASVLYEWGVKKRACDQCNHSKVRCDFADPCPMSPKSPYASSPNTSNSVIAPTEPVSYRKPSVTSLPPNLGNVPNPSNAQSMPWVSYQTTMGTSWPSSQAQATYSIPDGTAPGSITGHFVDSPGVVNPALPSYSSQPQAQAEQSLSPHRLSMTQTPSLADSIDTSSEMEMDDPAERRGSTNSFISSVPRAQWGSKSKEVEGVLRSIPNADAFEQNQSPIQTTSHQVSPVLGRACQLSDRIPNTQWQSQGTINPKWQMRGSFSSDDESSSVLSSSANSTFLDQSVNSSANHEDSHHERRRSSGSTWDKAMEQMSIQDPQKNKPIVGENEDRSVLTVPEILETASEGTQELNDLVGTNTEQSSMMPTLSDVKDLWRIFMTEPATGLTPAGEKLNELDNIPVITPRPGMGKRTFSKSTSMPDLQSPLVAGPAFFSTFLNGMTPKPTEAQQSYMPSHLAEKDRPIVTEDLDEPDMGKWSKEIEQRQSSFSLGKPNAKLGKGKADTLSRISGVPNQPLATHPTRPLASVVQRSSALDQTLAPERLPSFGLTPGFEIQNPLLSKLGLASADARAGSKRMASSTLANDHKKATFTVWDEEGPATQVMGQVRGQRARRLQAGEL